MAVDIALEGLGWLSIFGSHGSHPLIRGGFYAR
jgi:hypothetical protein